MATPPDTRSDVPPWLIEFASRPGVRSPVPGKILTDLAGRALFRAGAPSPASLTLILADDAELAALNAEHMGEDGPTDVLSFPLLPPSAFPDHVGKSEDPSSRPVEPPFATPADQIPHLGDVIISMERARAQASGPLGDELRALVVHGVLHICGWDHAETAERDAMRAFERDLLSEP